MSPSDTPTELVGCRLQIIISRADCFNRLDTRSREKVSFSGSDFFNTKTVLLTLVRLLTMRMYWSLRRPKQAGKLISQKG